MKSLSYRLSSLAALVLAMLLNGCATRTEMALHDNPAVIPPKSQAIFLLTVDLRNDYKPGYQPNLIVTYVEKPGAQSKAERLNFVTDDRAPEILSSNEAGKRYYLRFELPPGDYIIQGFLGMYRSLLLNGTCLAPLHVPLRAGPAGVIYLGHVKEVIRERKGSEFRAGAPVPLIDQAVCGFSGGTFDVEITDAMDDDLKFFRRQFRALENVKIEKAILPPFDRTVAQKFWEEN